MQTSDMVRMANQIADFFAPYPRPEAIDGIGKHVHLFWEPRMRNKLKAHLDAGGDGLSPLFVAAAHDYFAGPKSPAAKGEQGTPAPTGARPQAGNSYPAVPETKAKPKA